MRGVPGDRSQARTRHGRGGGKGLAVNLVGWLGFKAPWCHRAARGCSPGQGNYVLLNVTMLFRLHRPLLRPVCRRKCHVPQQLPGLVSAGIAQAQILPPPAGPVQPVVTTPAHHRCCRGTNGVPRPTGHQSVHKIPASTHCFPEAEAPCQPHSGPLARNKVPAATPGAPWPPAVPIPTPVPPHPPAPAPLHTLDAPSQILHRAQPLPKTRAPSLGLLSTRQERAEPRGWSCGVAPAPPSAHAEHGPSAPRSEIPRTRPPPGHPPALSIPRGPPTPRPAPSAASRCCPRGDAQTPAGHRALALPAPPPRILGAQRGWGHPGTAEPTAHLSPYPR